jgi:hypothetical protein
MISLGLNMALDVEAKLNKGKGTVQREQVDLISMIRSQSKPTKLDVAVFLFIKSASLGVLCWAQPLTTYALLGNNMKCVALLSSVSGVVLLPLIMEVECFFCSLFFSTFDAANIALL